MFYRHFFSPLILGRPLGGSSKPGWLKILWNTTAFGWCWWC